MQRLVVILTALLVAGACGGALLAWKALGWRQGFKSYKALYQDFGGIAEHSAADAELAVSGHRLDAVFLGASHTQDWGDLKRWFPGLRIANRGVGGQAVPQYLLRFRQDVLDLHPRAVVIEGCAVNATYGMPARAVIDSYASMAELARIHGVEPILATTTPISAALEKQQPGTNDQIRKINDAMRQVARSGGYRVVDYYSAVADPDGALPAAGSSDGLHGNEKIYDRMAQALRPVLEDALKAVAPVAPVERSVLR
ncbi:MAG: hypothetical protein LAO51_05700 [Acidobacteriia bacterium]|nr:hypothetical protein [Terriglobia bacterium]